MRYFIADTHFGHDLIRAMLRRYPGTKDLFPSVEAHDEFLLRSINSTVQEQDELFILGDFSRQPGKYRARINCKHVYLVRGNHDPVQKCLNVFGQIPWIRKTKVRKGGESLKVVLCHFPFAYWEGSHNGWGHLYGHTHAQREGTMCDGLGRERRSFDVGVDNLMRVFGHYAPISEEVVFDGFTSIKGHDDREFYRKLQAIRDEDFFNAPDENSD